MTVGDLHADWSKHRATDETMRLLVAVAEAAGLRRMIDAMFAGEHINVTEDRAVLHVALRAPAGERIVVDGADVVPDVHARARPHGGVRRPGAQRGVDGLHRPGRPQRREHRHRRVGPRPGHGVPRPCATSAGATSTFRFVSNVDGADICEATHDLDPEETLFIVVVEDVHDASRRSPTPPRRSGGCRSGCRDPEAIARHFVAVSTNAAEVAAVRDRHRRTCSSSGTGSAAATPTTRRSACR